ncbi:hypothetical protein ABPH35_05930 [Streptococcus sp. ZJ93]|uniref:hypothetical protein n=1 Tax=Streptococcus handemini TaxID=3161188 RepID=UPI0032EECE2A
MKKCIKYLLGLALVSSLSATIAVSADSLLTNASTAEYGTLSRSRVIYTWESFDQYSFTRIMQNANGFNIPVRFENTGDKRIIRGRPQYRYVGIIEDTNFGVTRTAPVFE